MVQTLSVWGKVTIQCDNLIGSDVDLGKSCSSVFSS